MTEFLIFAQKNGDSNNWQYGDIVSIKPSPFKWGRKELTDKFLIIKSKIAYDKVSHCCGTISNHKSDWCIKYDSGINNLAIINKVTGDLIEI